MAEEDILFGKNRHLFGGITPGNMRKFTVSAGHSGDGYGSSCPLISWELPRDTVIDGQTVCSVAGAVIRRKEDGWPVDEFDGEEFAVVTEDGCMYDILGIVTDTSTNIYYAAFPYSTQGVYNRNKENRAAFYGFCVNYGGDGFWDPSKQKPSSWCSVKGFARPGKCENVIQCMFPANNWMIRASENGYPEEPTDGRLVYNETGVSGGPSYYTDDYYDLTRTTMYYTIFPYDDNGTYMYNDYFRISLKARKYGYFFGFDIDMDDPNPNTRVTYPSEVNNATFTPAKMNFESGVFEYNDWSFTVEDSTITNPSFMPQPVRLTYDGSVACTLDINHYGYINGSTNTSGITSTGTDGNAMMRWPKIYVKREVVNGVYKFRCSDAKIDSTYECICNYDKDNNEVDYFYTPIYEGYLYNSKLRSLSGYSPQTAISPTQSVSYASGNGSRWTTEVLADRLLIQDLLILMAKTTDCQKAYGKGVCGGSTALKTGTMDNKGLFWGSNDPSEGVKVFGMENWWGNHSRYLAGLLTHNNSFYVKFTRGTKDGSTGTDYATSSYSGYTLSNGSLVASGYISKMELSAHGRIPTWGYGSSTTYEADTATMASSSSSIYYPATGGHYSSTERDIGPFMLWFPMAGSTSTTTSQYVGASLSYK